MPPQARCRGRLVAAGRFPAPDSRPAASPWDALASRAELRAIAGRGVAQLGQLHVAVLRDQPIYPQPSAATSPRVTEPRLIVRLCRPHLAQVDSIRPRAD